MPGSLSSIKRLLVYGNSLLLVQQVNKEWDLNKDTMDVYVEEIRKLKNKFSGLEIHHVIRYNNVGADVLSKLGSDRANVPPGVFVHELHHPSIKTPDSNSISQSPKEPDREVLMIEVNWRVTFIDYIQEHKLPPGVDPISAEATHILRCSKGYILVGDNLYKRGSATGILMKCVRTEEGREILREIHKGVCGNHAASRTLVGKALCLVSTSQLLWHMPKHSFTGAQTASSSANSPMSWLTTSSPYHLHDCLHAGVWT
jgi:hypothetical protein